MVGLQIVNRGAVNTCVRQNGGSIVDLTWASAVIERRIYGWQVAEETETLSDHRYIRFEVGPLSGSIAPSSEVTNGPRWALKRLKVNMVREAAIVATWPSLQDGPADVDWEVERFQRIMTHFCDASIPRARPQPPRRCV